LYFHVRSYERVGLRREKSLFAVAWWVAKARGMKQTLTRLDKRAGGAPHVGFACGAFEFVDLRYFAWVNSLQLISQCRFQPGLPAV